MKLSIRFLPLVAGTWLMACSNLPIVAVSATSLQQQYQPEPGKALVIFMRTGFYGAAIPAGIYDVRDSGDTFVAALSSLEDFAYQAEPGRHLFMVANEGADFVDAELAAGKTYYVVIRHTPKDPYADFDSLAVRRAADAEFSLDSKHFQRVKAEGHYVDVAQELKDWARDNAAVIAKVKAQHLPAWQAKSADEKADHMLKPEDGV